MATIEGAPPGAEPAIPRDTFRVRIAMIRALMGWNYTQAGEICDVGVENWRKWEKTDRVPHDYEEVCRKIADGSGFDRVWVTSGGPLSNTWSTTLVPTPSNMQGSFFFGAPPLLDLVASG